LEERMAGREEEKGAVRTRQEKKLPA